MRRAHPLIFARIATVLHPISALVLVLVGGPAASLFTILHGAGNGLLTIGKGTLPLAFSCWLRVADGVAVRAVAGGASRSAVAVRAVA